MVLKNYHKTKRLLAVISVWFHTTMHYSCIICWINQPPWLIPHDNVVQIILREQTSCQFPVAEVNNDEGILKEERLSLAHKSRYIPLWQESRSLKQPVTEKKNPNEYCHSIHLHSAGSQPGSGPFPLLSLLVCKEMNRNEERNHTAFCLTIVSSTDKINYFFPIEKN